MTLLYGIIIGAASILLLDVVLFGGIILWMCEPLKPYPTKPAKRPIFKCDHCQKLTEAQFSKSGWMWLCPDCFFGKKLTVKPPASAVQSPLLIKKPR